MVNVGMAHSDYGWTCGRAGKTARSVELHVRYLSASGVVFHEEALYQVYLRIFRFRCHLLKNSPSYRGCPAKFHGCTPNNMSKYTGVKKTMWDAKSLPFGMRMCWIPCVFTTLFHCVFLFFLHACTSVQSVVLFLFAALWCKINYTQNFASPIPLWSSCKIW